VRTDGLGPPIDKWQKAVNGQLEKIKKLEETYENELILRKVMYENAGYCSTLQQCMPCVAISPAHVHINKKSTVVQCCTRPGCPAVNYVATFGFQFAHGGRTGEISNKTRPIYFHP